MSGRVRCAARRITLRKREASVSAPPNRTSPASMVVQRQELEAAITQVVREPSFAGLPPGGLVLAWDPAARLVWVSAGAQARPDTGELPRPTAERIKYLAAGAAPRQALRLERLRFDPSRLAPPITCACRLIEVAGETVLVTAVVGPAPNRLPRVETAGPGAAEPPLGRGTSAPAPFGGLVEDPSGEVETLFARRETWSSRTIFWKVAGSDLSVPVDFAGLPLLRRNGQLIG